VAQNLGLPGQWFQLEHGLVYNWHRHYDPTTGRYTTADPLGFVDGPSVFAYAGSAPHKTTDPMGLASSGTPGNNSAQNKQFRDACTKLGLNKDQRNRLHREISGQGMGFHEILQTGKDMFGK
jgi:RHS repeat-associated protein